MDPCGETVFNVALCHLEQGCPMCIKSNGLHAFLARGRRSPWRRSLSVESLENRSLLSASPGSAAAATTFADEPAITAQVFLGADGFVRALYSDVLGRIADAGGLAFYKGLLDNGTPPAEVVDSIWESAEHCGVQVDGFYHSFLNRVADPEGRQFYVDSMLGGMSEEAAVTSFVTSTEFQRLNPPPGQFVDTLYNDLLERASDQEGLAFWINELQNNFSTTVDVGQIFVNSPERHQVLVTSYYTDFLARAPDAEGLAFWQQHLDQGFMDVQSVAEAFLSSTEYVKLHSQ
jgi:hypothetical protein